MHWISHVLFPKFVKSVSHTVYSKQIFLQSFTVYNNMVNELTLKIIAWNYL